ncbi:hypothetical protein NX059_000913 [Plenodomus lindquistii]|nr:hypothetical protein NX059_000913 [Plenodomus lindquistii]
MNESTFGTTLTIGTQLLGVILESVNKFIEAKSMYCHALYLLRYQDYFSSTMFSQSNGTEVVSVLLRLGHLCETQVELKTSENCFKAALQLMEDQENTTPELMFAALEYISDLYLRHDKGVRAIQLLNLSFQGRMASGESIGAIIALKNKISILSSKTQEEVDAELHLKSAFERSLQNFGPDHLGTVNAMYRLGKLLLEKKEYSSASEHLEKALQVVEQKCDPNGQEIMAILGDLAEVYLLQGRGDLAGPMFERTIQLFARTYGEKDLYRFSTIIRAFRRLGDCYEWHERLDLAEFLRSRAEAAMQKCLRNLESGTFYPEN